MKLNIRRKICREIPYIVAVLLIPLGVYRFGMPLWPLCGIIIMSFGCGVISQMISRGG